MFGKQRKRTNSDRKIKWYTWLIDLVIVFIGVYLAFLFNGYSESKKNTLQRDKVLSSLKYELEYLRFSMPGFEGHQKKLLQQWQDAYNKDSITDFYNYIFVQPQYDYVALEYAININEVEVVDFEMFTELRQLYNAIKKLESAENMMTESAQKFRNIHGGLTKKSAEYLGRRADNKFYFLRFRLAAVARAENLALIAELSTKALHLINQRMDLAKRLEIEKQLLVKYLNSLDQLPPKEHLIPMIKKFFPHFTEKEFEGVLDQFYNK